MKQIENNLEASEVLTYMVTDAVAGIIHAAHDLGFARPEIEDAIRLAMEHAAHERAMLTKGICTGCEKPFRAMRS